jgi:hypothetical protein
MNMPKHSNLLFYLISIFLLMISACNHGLSPKENESSQLAQISGAIFYQNWPADSLFDLRLVVFEHYPPENILNEVLLGRATVYPDLGELPLPFYVDTTFFWLEIDPGTYEYIAVAQQYGPEITSDWRAVGQYNTIPGDSLPTPITVNSGELLDNIIIYVDFDDLPPQPF